jgi:putative acetyltransferase
MLTLLRCNSDNPDFKRLVALLDRDLNGRYGDLQSDYDQFNVVELIDTVVVARMDDQAVGCGCFKPFDGDTVEIKRMFVVSDHRGKGIAGRILDELEHWAVESGFSRSVLETGIKQTEAIGLYQKKGYAKIENYGQYIGMENSVCFGKRLHN